MKLYEYYQFYYYSLNIFFSLVYKLNTDIRGRHSLMQKFFYGRILCPWLQAHSYYSFYISIHFRIHIMIESYKIPVLNLHYLVFWYKGKLKANKVQILILYIDSCSLEYKIYNFSYVGYVKGITVPFSLRTMWVNFKIHLAQSSIPGPFALVFFTIWSYDFPTVYSYYNIFL